MSKEDYLKNQRLADLGLDKEPDDLSNRPSELVHKPTRVEWSHYLSCKTRL
jgi:hypothetical protein